MAGAVVAVCFLLASAVAADKAHGSSAAQVTPIQKVIQLLQDMRAKGEAEKHAEEKEFAEFHEWCDGVRAAKTKSIKEAAAQIVQLKADIQTAEADAEALANEIGELEAAIAKAEADASSATSVRKKEHTDYLAAHTDFSESIDAIQRAVQVLRARTADVPQSLAQLSALRSVPEDAKAVLNSFLATRESGLEAGAPEANAYEFQSGGVVDMLEKLELKFKDQLLALEKAEISGKSNYQVLMQQLTDDIKADKATSSKKTKTKASRLDDAAIAKGDLQTTETTKAEDEKTLGDTKAECQASSEEFEKNQVTRAEEVKAIKKAVEILSSEAVSGHAETHLPAAAMLQATTRAKRALAQLQGSRHGDPALRQQVVDLLQAQAQRLNSRFLAVAASHAAADPFAKVKKMVQDLIIKLSEEANAEADSHAYCQTELATNKATRTNKAAEVEELAATSEQLTSESAQLASEIQQLSDAIAEIKGQQAEATKIRSEEKATNAKTVADAKEAQVAVAKATEVLRAFYTKASDASFVQSGQGRKAGSLRRTAASQAGKAPYQGQQDSSTGVLGILEVVLSDFVRLESETSRSEEIAAAAHQKFMDESNESVAVKETAMEHKTSKKALTDEKARSTKKELELTHEELDRAMEYHDQLKAQCVEAGLSFEERTKAREAEIQSLKEALAILEQGDLA